MKRKDLIKQLRQFAKDNGLEVVETEGSNHTRFIVGGRRTVVARHNEIPEVTVRKILKQIGAIE
ncbi:type II toxin-antitoxin system HicA family toxin [Aeromicrobium sp. CF3.5]|uniref:type II toxin-antitoxin system HicA family toxin n=1 Tax=Aeromicrobium sp. CF3.5 TaxID=3373078 RepID=UPI003EE57AC8